MASEPSESEREQIEEDIERLQLALQADEDEKSDGENDDEDTLRIVENADKDGDSQPGFTLSEDGSISKHPETNIIGIEELPVNAETSLALNRTYQELILDSLRKIEIALAENREKQNLLEEGLEQKTLAPKPKEKEGGPKKKSMVSYIKPYFKGPFGQFPPDNDDVKLKRVMKELEQNIQPPLPWSSAQRKTLQEAVKNDALKQRLTPLMNRKELLMEKSDGLHSELGILVYQLRQRNEALEEEGGVKEYEEEEKEALEKLNIQINQKNEAVKEIQDKVQAVNQEIENVKGTSTLELLSSVNIDSVDWLMIANSVMEGKRTVTECQMMWKNVLHPSINKGHWPQEEINRLQTLVEAYQMSNWPAIAAELGTGRTPFQCLQYYQQYLNETYSKREWSPEEDTMLQEVVENCQYGDWISWGQVSYFIDGRSPQQCSNRWTSINPNIRRGKWSAQEDCRLITAVRLHGTKAWSTVKDYVPGRTSVQCRDRYQSSLDPNLKAPNLWSYEEDKKLLLLVSKEMEENGRISWVRIARQLQGRSDNSVLIRYRRLMTWKEKCEWVEGQSDSNRQAMGLLNITKHGKNGKVKTEAQKKQEVEQTSHAFKLAELNEGIKRQDYIKQLEDKKKGEFVVPRPPLMCRYSTRSFRHVWDRKRQLFNMIHTHLAKEIPNISTPHERQELPEQTTEEFKDFVNLNLDQQEVLKKLLKEKGPGEITVREILNLSRAVGHSRNCVIKRRKRFKDDAALESKMQEVIMWKQYYSICLRKRCGRPRKFNICDPFEEEDKGKDEKITNITMSLLMNALDVDQKAALHNYKHKTDSKKRDVPFQDINFLEKLCSGKMEEKKEPEAEQKNLETDSDITLGMPLVHVIDEAMEASGCYTENSKKSHESSVNDTEPSSTQSCQTRKSPVPIRPKSVRVVKLPPGQKLKPGMNISDFVSQNYENIRVFKNSQPAVVSEADDNNPAIMRSLPLAVETVSTTQTQSTESNSQETPNALSSAHNTTSAEAVEILSLEPADLESVPSSASHLPDKTPVIQGSTSFEMSSSENVSTAQQLQTNSNSSLEPSEVSDSNKQNVNSNTKDSVSDTVMESTSASSSSVRTHCQKGTRPSGRKTVGKSLGSKVKVLPPCLTTVQAFEGLLLHKRLLMTRAGRFYSKKLYRKKSVHLQRELDKLIKPEPFTTALSEDKVKEDPTMKLLKEMEKTSYSKTAQKAGARLTQTDDDHFLTDPLAVARKTTAYQQLQQRFKALFMWPALLSTIAPSESSVENHTRYISTHAKIGRKLKKLVQQAEVQGGQKKQPGRKRKKDRKNTSNVVQMTKLDNQAVETTKSVTDNEESNSIIGQGNSPPKKQKILMSLPQDSVNLRNSELKCQMIRVGGIKKRDINKSVSESPSVPPESISEGQSPKKAVKRRIRKNYTDFVSQRTSGRIAQRHELLQQIKLEKEANKDDDEGKERKRKRLVGIKPKKVRYKSTFSDATRDLTLVPYKINEGTSAVKQEMGIPMIVMDGGIKPLELQAQVASMTSGLNTAETVDSKVLQVHTVPPQSLPGADTPGIVPVAMVVIPDLQHNDGSHGNDGSDTKSGGETTIAHGDEVTMDFFMDTSEEIPSTAVTSSGDANRTTFE